MHLLAQARMGGGTLDSMQANNAPTPGPRYHMPVLLPLLLPIHKHVGTAELPISSGHMLSIACAVGNSGCEAFEKSVVLSNIRIIPTRIRRALINVDSAVSVPLVSVNP